MSNRYTDEYNDDGHEEEDEEEDEAYDEDEDDESDDDEDGDLDDGDEDDGDEGEDNDGEEEDEDDESDESDDDDTDAGQHSFNKDDVTDEDEAGTISLYEEGLVYVIMPYTDEHLNEVFKAISDECSSLGLNAQLANEGIGSGLVTSIIRDLTERAEFIVCDLTGERANVYYELGQAHGLGNDASRVLLIAKQGTPLSFNVAALHVYYYQSTENLRSVIATNLGRMIQATRE
jgi:hypothetical protein